MDKKTLLAIVLSLAVWGIWYFGMKVFKPEPAINAPLTEKTETREAKKEIQEPDNISLKPEQQNVSTFVVNRISSGTEKTVEIKTSKYSFVISNRGASIQSVRYSERDVELVVSDNNFNSSGLLGFNVHFNNNEFMFGNALDRSVWNFGRTDRNAVEFYIDTTINNSPVRLVKKYVFDSAGYSFRIEYGLRNRGWKALDLGAMMTVSPSDMLGPSLDFSNTYNRISSIYSMNGEFKQGTKGGGFFSNNKDALNRETGNINWFGIMSRYFLVIMIPEGFTGTGVVYDNRPESGFRTGMSIPAGVIKAGTEFKKSFKVYLGEKDKDRLKSVDPAIVDAADVSKLIEPIRFIVLWMLNKINMLVGNMGWALVLFSLLTKIVFLPLTRKSNESMKNMQKLTPKLNELKAKHKDKPDVLQKEMMKLYKDNKVNPLGGCFPMLLQMPFFFALYSALINSIDLWHAPFIFWISDLSMPDTVATIEGFNVNILPLLMTGSTFLQQKLTSVETGGGQQQKMMMMMMPVVFIFIFWSMPSGLVLYWTLQNLFQVAHQLIINRIAKTEK